MDSKFLYYYIWVRPDLHNLVVSVCAKFEGCAAKTVGEVGFLPKAHFFAVAVLPIPRSRLPELRYRLEIQNGRSH